jgi:hypothetical protein
MEETEEMEEKEEEMCAGRDPKRKPWSALC